MPIQGVFLNMTFTVALRSELEQPTNITMKLIIFIFDEVIRLFSDPSVCTPDLLKH